MWILDELEKRKEDTTIAIRLREKAISFAELWRKSEILSVWLKNNTKTNNPILIYGNKDIEIVIVMLAALKAGKAYVPLDITFPIKRVEEISEETKSEWCFSFVEDIDESKNTFRALNREKLNDIVCRSEIEKSNRGDWVQGNENCYILFTSGSTGKPKGVQISKDNIINFVSWFTKMCEIPKDKQVVLNQVSYSFDVSVISLYIYLALGKTLFCIDKKMTENLGELFSYLKESDIATWISTPTFLEICSFDEKFNDKNFKNLERIILAGEVLTKKLVANIKSRFSEIQIINGYGPTEGTVLLSACEITKAMLESERDLPIGYILTDGEYKIVGDDNCQVAEGETGELVVISNSISKGYFNNLEQTEKVFFKSRNGKMGYKTGDLVYELEGLLYYVARKDTQVKLNGFRIELTDISNNLNKISAVKNSIVLPVYKEGRVSYLVGFLTLKEEMEMSSLKQGIQIKNELKKLIPSYMVPRRIVIIDEFPMNTNGKIDRKRLVEEYL